MSGLQNWWIITWTASGYNPFLVTCSANLPAVKQDEKASVFAVFVTSRPFTGPLLGRGPGVGCPCYDSGHCRLVWTETLIQAGNLTPSKAG